MIFLKQLGIFLLCIVFFTPFTVAAHTTKTSGTIFITLHTEPGDVPVAGGESALVFNVEDTSRKFSLKECLCHLTVEKDGKKILEEPLSRDETYDVVVPVIFPEAALYRVILAATSSEVNVFEPFVFTYDIRVEQNADGENRSHFSFRHHKFHIILFSAAIVFSAWVVVWDKPKK
jgi:hypothetical protein